MTKSVIAILAKVKSWQSNFLVILRFAMQDKVSRHCERIAVTIRGNLNRTANDLRNAQLEIQWCCHDFAFPKSRNDDNTCHTEAFEKSRSISNGDFLPTAQNDNNRDISFLCF